MTPWLKIFLWLLILLGLRLEIFNVTYSTSINGTFSYHIHFMPLSTSFSMFQPSLTFSSHFLFYLTAFAIVSCGKWASPPSHFSCPLFLLCSQFLMLELLPWGLTTMSRLNPLLSSSATFCVSPFISSHWFTHIKL